MAKLSLLAIAAAWVIALAMLRVGPDVLPEKYFTDSNRMAVIAETREPGRASKSDVATAAFYRSLGIRGPTMVYLAGLWNVTTAFLALVFLQRGRAGSPLAVALLFPWLTLLGVYLSMYSKEYLTFMCVLVAILGLRRKAGLVFGCLVFLCYGVFVRVYWIAILAYAVAFWILLRTHWRTSVKVLLSTAGVLASLVVFREVTGVHLTDARELLSSFRVGDPDSRTLVLNVVANQGVASDFLNLAVAWIQFLLPVTLVRFGGLQHIAFCLLQIATVVTGVAMMTARAKNGWQLRSEERLELIGVTALALAFTIVHAAFDADFGSYARHQIALVPLLLAALMPRVSGDGPGAERVDAKRITDHPTD